MHYIGRHAAHDSDRVPGHLSATAGTGMVVALLVVGMAVLFLREAPQLDWVLVLTAAVILLVASLVSGLRQWLRDRQR